MLIRRALSMLRRGRFLTGPYDEEPKVIGGSRWLRLANTNELQKHELTG